jgi:hypothetical protein
MEIAQRIIPYIISGAWKFDSPEERLRQRIGFWQVGIHQIEAKINLKLLL